MGWPWGDFVVSAFVGEVVDVLLASRANTGLMIRCVVVVARMAICSRVAGFRKGISSSPTNAHCQFKSVKPAARE